MDRGDVPMLPMDAVLRDELATFGPHLKNTFIHFDDKAQAARPRPERLRLPRSSSQHSLPSQEQLDELSSDLHSYYFLNRGISPSPSNRPSPSPEMLESMLVETTKKLRSSSSLISGRSTDACGGSTSDSDGTAPTASGDSDNESTSGGGYVKFPSPYSPSSAMQTGGRYDESETASLSVQSDEFKGGWGVQGMGGMPASPLMSMTVTPEERAAAGSWSFGTTFHQRGTCNPCRYEWTKGCHLGSQCRFCHHEDHTPNGAIRVIPDAETVKNSSVRPDTILGGKKTRLSPHQNGQDDSPPFLSRETSPVHMLYAAANPTAFYLPKRGVTAANGGGAGGAAPLMYVYSPPGKGMRMDRAALKTLGAPNRSLSGGLLPSMQGPMCDPTNGNGLLPTPNGAYPAPRHISAQQQLELVGKLLTRNHPSQRNNVTDTTNMAR
ncbi:unnamed protein product [Vitrella brassicaformis CCMP3155]|uniref:C3H1-type domain-containing protein n=2 Tax=Vitrella brassicaformis TaxID=1169539 RepID=A0A0G4EWN1_VITBC|nr:unnamed protein product [Vitrella brassicaformis CCMP3155]|eukprot:CEM02474.1 unnamed protein product [Vitrella brassicaformis CCMP3155]